VKQKWSGTGQSVDRRLSDETNFKTEEDNSRKSGVKNNYGLNITAPQV
jgi:hypothetical protein